MKEIIERIIELESKTNKDFLARFPDHGPIFDYRKASDIEIAEFEREFSIKLSKCTIEYLKQFNPIKVSLMFVELLGLDAIRKNHEKFVGYSDALGQGLLPIGDENGDLICIDTKNEDGRLLIYSHEDDQFQEMWTTLEFFLTELVKRIEDKKATRDNGRQQ